MCRRTRRSVSRRRARPIARIAKEGRKYGAYLGVVTQRPGELDPTILSQCSTVFAMRLGNERDQEIIRAAIADASASTIAFLSSIGNREAIAFGEAVATTMRMRFLEQRPEELPAMAGRLPSQAEQREPLVEELVARMRGL
jgi:DNA helicase HerA-like ATPase